MNWFYLHLTGTRHAITRVHEPILTYPLGTKKWHIFNYRINTDISFDEGASPVMIPSRLTIFSCACVLLWRVYAVYSDVYHKLIHTAVLQIECRTK